MLLSVYSEMEKLKLLNIFVVLCSIGVCLSTIVINKPDRYDPTWESLDKRPLPKWYDEAKIGIFLHWGVFSVPSFGSEWFWHSWKSGKAEYVKYMKDNYPPSFTYQDFAPEFKAEFFNATEWAQLFKKSGAKYIVLTSKHHDGYTLWPSTFSFSWNAKDVGPQRDLLGELAQAVRKLSLTFGVYHSLFEWFNPIYLRDGKSNFTRDNFVTQKIVPEMVEVVENYKPEVIWSDGDWEAPDKYWKSTSFLEWLYNESPVKDTVVVNDRWGINISCHHGDFYTCSDRYNPHVLQKHKWENAMTLDKESWGYRRNTKIENIYSISDLLQEVAITVSCGGNILINIGPTPEGTISPIYQERLLQLGHWLSINGEAIYGTSPWKSQNDTLANTVWYTAKGTDIYAIILKWPNSNTLELQSVADLFKTESVKISLLGSKGELKWKLTNKYVSIQMPDKADVACDWAWVLKIPSQKSEDINSLLH